MRHILCRKYPRAKTLCKKIIYDMTIMQTAQFVAQPRLERRNHLYDLADAQAGYFTAAQARALGFLNQYQQHHRQTGAWQQVDRGVFRLRDYPPTEHEQLVQLSLWSHNRPQQPQAVVSHQTALAFYQLSDLMPAKIHLTVPPSFRKTPPPVVVLHRGHLEKSDCQPYGGFRVTTPLRTLLDVALDHLSPEHLQTATQQALERGLVRLSALKTALKHTELPRGVLEVFQWVLEGK